MASRLRFAGFGVGFSVWVWFWVGSLVVVEFAGVMGLASLAVYFCFVGLV